MSELSEVGFESHPSLEIVIDPKTGKLRQAGTIDPQHQAILNFKAAAERSLYFFAKFVMGVSILTDRFHKPECEWMQRIPPRRKWMLWPRDHCKTTIVGRSLPIHALIQPQENNVYFPGCQNKMCMYARETTGAGCDVVSHRFDGCDTRILLGYETATLAEAQLSAIEASCMSNTLLRALWPHRFWTDDTAIRSEKKRWNKIEMEIPRNIDFPEASITRIGVDGAITGRHFTMHIFDDLVTEKASNSEIIMSDTTRWVKASRALMDDLRHSLEFVIGTHWAVGDVYQQNMTDWDNKGNADPTVEHRVRSIIEDGEIIFPEQGFTEESIGQLERQDPALFSLMYMNNVYASNLVDFSLAELREFEYSADGRGVVFTDDDRDVRLANQFRAPISSDPDKDYMGLTLNEALVEMSAGGRNEYLKQKYGAFKTT